MDSFRIEALSDEVLDAFLRAESTARIGYVDQRGQPYVVPVTYAYDGESFYGYSLLGAKIESMNMNPRVCVEVDRITNVTNWICAVALGDFESLHGARAEDAVRRIADRLRTIARADALSAAAEETYVARVGGPGLAYRIRVAHKSGRRGSDLPR
ncbi:MAG TPA: pyridoxamine 5'-phosphate oxidase family protein [Candidatus Baltobacteraceae bacterium]|nr:pyridoxamine 5'-phosphate oxidase family protein [Candidatus Baltobacteraceae bacterium]